MAPASPNAQEAAAGEAASASTPKLPNTLISSISLPDEDVNTPVTDQAVSMADLLRELQKINRLLSGMALQNSPDQPSSSSVLQVMPRSPSPLPRIISPQPFPQSPAGDPKLVIRKALELVQELAHSGLGASNKRNVEDFRRTIIGLMVKPAPPHQGDDEYWEENRGRTRVGLLIKSSDSSGRQTFRKGFWIWWTNRFFPVSPLTPQEHDAVSEEWPVQFDIDKITYGIYSMQNGWILGRRPKEDGALIACPLFYGPDGHVLPADQILHEQQRNISAVNKMVASDLTSPGSIWHFTTPTFTNGVLPLRRLAQIAAVCALPPGENSDPHREFLHEFCAAWKPLHIRTSGHDHRGWAFHVSMSYQHTIRCFSTMDANGDVDLGSHLRLGRETGRFPSLSPEDSESFIERRMSVSCRWLDEPKDGKPRSFQILLIGDFQSVKQNVHERNDLFTDWQDRRFVVRGGNAGYHTLQSVVHRMMVFWEKDWSNCLDGLENAVNTQLRDILSEEVSNTLMFDVSFARSRVYFQTLEMLRVFTDTIRETGRDLQEMDPERLLQKGFLRAGFDVRSVLPDDPVKDEALWENWRILSEFQKGAEERLLRRIAERTEEFKSLRDGLFNATSLREASRSTTMNRYIIVFTIMTILYLPASFTATLFGTDLFNAPEESETVNRFKDSTIITCVVTYVLAFILILVADKWDIAGTVYRELRLLWRPIWVRVKRHRWRKISFGGESTERLTAGPPPGEKVRRLSV